MGIIINLLCIVDKTELMYDDISDITIFMQEL